MHKKTLIGLALLVILGTVLGFLFLEVTEPPPVPLPEIGMTKEEVLYGPVGVGTGRELEYCDYRKYGWVNPDTLGYITPEDQLGRSRGVIVVFSSEGKVTSWRVHSRGTGWRSEFWNLIGR